MNNYDLIKNIAQLFIQQLQATVNLTTNDIREQVEKACQSPGVDELIAEEKEKLLKFNGELHIDSSPNKGATIIIKLPN